jgi:hypothetical protein
MYKCTNEECKNFDIKVRVQQIKWAIPNHCASCVRSRSNK